MLRLPALRTYIELPTLEIRTRLALPTQGGGDIVNILIFEGDIILELSIRADSDTVVSSAHHYSHVIELHVLASCWLYELTDQLDYIFSAIEFCVRLDVCL